MRPQSRSYNALISMAPVWPILGRLTHIRINMDQIETLKKMLEKEKKDSFIRQYMIEHLIELYSEILEEKD